MRISACMIVKNEEEMLPRCLDSIKWLVDEIIVVDTGSTDKTMDIAREYGAKIYEHPWQNDFSLHRNQSIGYATGDWILIIDADEELMPMEVTKERFLKRLAKLPLGVTALLFTVQEIRLSSQWRGARLFRKEAGLVYKGIVHNRPNIEFGKIGASDIQLRHYGYSLGKKKDKEKNDRSTSLLLKRIEENPDDWDAMYYMAKYAMAAKDHQKVIDWGSKSLRTYEVIETTKDLGYHGCLYFMIGQSHLRLDDPDSAYCWFIKGLSMYPEDIDLNYCMALLGYLTGRKDFIKTYGTKYLDLIKNLDKPNDAKSFEQELPKVMTSSRAVNYLHPKYEAFLKEWMASD